jgi:hypothetical protein
MDFQETLYHRKHLGSQGMDMEEERGARILRKCVDEK